MKRSKLVIYEWVIKEVQDDGDYREVYHFDTASEMFESMKRPLSDGIHYEFGLLRDEYHPDDPDELVLRQYAYVKDGILPEEMDEGTKVPKFIRKEFDEATR